MKLFALSLVSLAVIASPVAAQQDQHMTTTHVRTTTKHVHATNVPVVRHHVVRHRHATRCDCPRSHMRHYRCVCTGHMRMHPGNAHHVVKKTIVTTTTSH